TAGAHQVHGEVAPGQLAERELTAARGRRRRGAHVLVQRPEAGLDVAPRVRLARDPREGTVRAGGGGAAPERRGRGSDQRGVDAERLGRAGDGREAASSPAAQLARLAPGRRAVDAAVAVPVVVPGERGAAGRTAQAARAASVAVALVAVVALL